MTLKRRCARLAAVTFLTLLLPHAAAEAADVLFPPDAVINVKDYGALPDDGKDDTAAIQKAITENVGTGRTIYFPAGTYQVSDTLRSIDKNGKWEAHITLQGDGIDKTILRLPKNTTGFGDPEKPKAMIMTGSHWNEGDSEDGGGNKAFRNNIRDISLDVSSGNTGTIGIEWAVSNQGTIRNVNISSETWGVRNASGVAGIAMKRRIPGPGLLSSVHITGFDIGVDIGDIQYGVTMDSVQTTGQRIAGVRIDHNLLFAHGFASGSTAPAILSTGDKATVTVVNSVMMDGRAESTGIEFRGSAANLLVRDTRAEKFGSLIQFGDGVKLSSSNAAPALIQPADPRYFRADISHWQPVGPRQDGESDDTAAIQRAIDTGKAVVYFPIKRDY
ncbi:MAG TPA: glycosyl hydrolase family 28-related protein, partial [Roseimicrobium sp.]|nr:glycosyl hydrolase family 28-related protein [Roseimicrobium sp.]